LRVLRRELANWLCLRDTDRYVQIYNSAHENGGGITVDREDQRRQLAALTKKYPLYADFDFIGTRDYVLYPDALAPHSYDEVADHYSDLIRFQALQAALDDDWWGFQTTSDGELAHLEEYVEKIKDARFRRRLKNAMREYHAWENGRHKDVAFYETNMLTVRRVQHFAETRYGILFKDTDEAGLYTVFHGDGGEIYTGFYRSDEKFEKEVYLDNIQLD
jgi:hypothetical protein